jgi:putative RecB family exonuclease
MTKEQAVQTLKEDYHLHISYSQIFVYLNCSLRYRFQYQENRLQERISVNLPFGSAIHSAVSRFYDTFRTKGTIEPLSILQDLFEDALTLELDHTEVPIIFKKEAPDRDSVISLGKAMVEAFYKEIDLSGYKVVGVEVPLSARLFTDLGVATDLKLAGIIDVLLMDQNQELLVVDYKTVVRAKDQDTVNQDLQFSAYAYLLCANKYAFPTAPVKCRMDVIRKLKVPKLEFYSTVRTAQDRKRFAKIANVVLRGIEQKVFLPNKSYLCSDCSYVRVCGLWSA